MSKYEGMSANERLFAEGLNEAFEAACEARNLGALRNLLAVVEVPDADIELFLERFADKEGNAE